MRSGPQDRTAASDVAAPTRNEIKAAKRNMDSLLEKFETCRRAATQPCNLQQAQELIDRVVEAGSTVLEYYANLPASLARRILPDDQARRLRDDTLDAGSQCNKLATQILYPLENRRKQAEALLDNVKDTATPDQLSRVVAGVANQYAACMEWWGKKALRFERMQSVCAATANLPSSTPEMREAEEAQLRLNTGWALNTKCMYLQSRIALAQLLIESQASTLAPDVRAVLMDESGRRSSSGPVPPGPRVARSLCSRISVQRNSPRRRRQQRHPLRPITSRCGRLRPLGKHCRDYLRDWTSCCSSICRLSKAPPRKRGR